MRLNKLFAVLSAAGIMAMVGPAQASITFQFNPLGNGTGVGLINGAGLLDQAPGNVNSINGAGGGGPVPVGTVITDLYQSNLSAVQKLSTANLFSNGDFGKFFTFVANFSERVTSAFIAGSDAVDIVSVNGGGTIKMCVQTMLGDNLSGVGFGCAGSGILSARVDSGSSSITAHLANPLQPLDQAGADDWFGTQTLDTDGSAKLKATVTFVDSKYFPDLRIGSKVALNSSFITPYNQVDPSRRFSTGLVTDDTMTDIGPINGLTGPNFIFQADANNSFDAPEPGVLALGGIALAGLAQLRSRRRQSA